MKKIYLRSVLLTSCLALTNALAQTTTTLNPVADANVYLYGGGQGGNAYLKFDISTIPAGATILAVDMEVYVKSFQAGWDADAFFYNVHNQAWTEANTMMDLNGYIKSDTTLQAAGFGAGLGWTTSTDLTTIFMEDFLVANQYCSILIRDPDDATMAPPAMPLADFDTLVVGNLAFNQAMKFYSSEAALPIYSPKLNITWCMDTESFLTETACDSFTLNATTYYAAGTYSQTVPNASGCDSTINLDLTLGVVDAGVTQDADTLMADASAATYQWINCADSSVIAGETSQTFTPSADGDYAVIVTQGTCSDTSACFPVDIAGFENDNTAFGVLLFPNPAFTEINFVLKNNSGQASIRLIDVAGQSVKKILVSGNSAVVNISDLPAGIYFAEIEVDGVIEIVKVVKK